MGRVYNTARWRALRKLKLSLNPLCEPCERRGQRIEARHVDHIVSIRSGGDPYPPLSALMSMCVSCHSIKTNAKDRAGGKGIAFKGCDQNGLPLDPSHPFTAPHTPLSGPKLFDWDPAPKSNTELVSNPVRDWGF